MKENKIKKSYNFFIEHERNKSGFNLSELENATDWSKVTIKTYLSKKWDKLLFKKADKYYVKGISNFTVGEYEKLMSQVNKNSQDPLKPDLDEDVERLVVKARESAMLALDIYNRPATMFKSEGFIVMMIIAWTSLLHAIFTKQKIRFFHVDDKGNEIILHGDLKAWELAHCLKIFYKEKHDACRKNIEFMIGLRNKIEHRFAPKIDNHIGGECQALLLNFDDLLTENFSNYYSLKDIMVFPMQTSNLRTVGQIEAVKKFQGKHYDEIKEYIDTFRGGISDSTYNDPKFSFRVYLIPKQGNHKNSSDMSMEFVKYDSHNPKEMEAHEKLVTLIKEKVVKVGNPNGLKAGQVVERIKKATGRKFSIYNHTQCWKYYEIRPSHVKADHYNEYCYCDTVHNDYVYTEDWVNFLSRKLTSEDEYIKVTTLKISK